MPRLAFFLQARHIHGANIPQRTRGTSVGGTRLPATFRFRSVDVVRGSARAHEAPTSQVLHAASPRFFLLFWI